MVGRFSRFCLMRATGIGPRQNELRVALQRHPPAAHPQRQVLVVDVEGQQADARRHCAEGLDQVRLQGQDAAVANATSADDQARLGYKGGRLVAGLALPAGRAFMSVGHCAIAVYHRSSCVFADRPGLKRLITAVHRFLQSYYPWQANPGPGRLACGGKRVAAPGAAKPGSHSADGRRLTQCRRRRAGKHV